MYSRFILYTCKLHVFNKLKFDIPIHVSRFCVFNKTYFGIKDKNNDMYMFHVYWTYVHMQHALK